MHNQVIQLVNKQRGSSRHCVNELSVNGQMYKTDITILDGWRDHFKSLATPSNEIDSDKKYSKLVKDEIPVIIELCKDTPATTISTEQVKKAIKSLNRGKAADYLSIYLFILQHPLTSIMCSCAVSAE